ncbi:MAG: AMP-binding protein [Vibrionaceae bacterium]
MSIFTKIADVAQNDPSKIALSDSAISVDYHTLWQIILQLEKKLNALAIKRLVLQLDNGLLWALLDLAAMKGGIVVIPMPDFFSKTQQEWVLENSGADACIGALPSAWAAREQSIEIPLIGLPEQKISVWRKAVAAQAALPPSTAKITYTSGTTGSPKGVCLAAEQIFTVSNTLAQNVAKEGLHTHFTLLPLTYLLENITGIYVPLLAGAESKIISLKEIGFKGSSALDVEHLVQALLRYPTDSLVLVPEILRLLLSLCGKNPLLLKQLQQIRYITVGGGAVASTLLQHAKNLHLSVYEGYGLSECASVVAVNTPHANKIGSVGKPLSHLQVKIASDGEITVFGNAMLGYLGEPDFKNAFIATGDLGRFDEEGYLYITGRKKNIQITAFGRNFSPEWVEAQAQACSAIARLVLFGDGLPCNVALIEPFAGEESQLSMQIAQLNRSLPDYAQIHTWILVSFKHNAEFLTANGRPRRKLIFEHFTKEINQAVNDKLAGEPK